jgi:alpha-N-acetylglucosaminidase
MALVGIAWTLAALLGARRFPIAKKTWTSSFVLLTTGIDLLVLAALAAGLEGHEPNPLTRFFQVFGRNPLVIYLFSELFVVTLAPVRGHARRRRLWLDRSLNLFQVLVPGALGSLLCATAYMLVCWLLGYVLDPSQYRRSV